MKIRKMEGRRNLFFFLILFTMFQSYNFKFTVFKTGGLNKKGYIVDIMHNENSVASQSKEQCKVIPFTQIVQKEGCESVEIKNNICAGTCVSVQLPFTSIVARSTLNNIYRTCIPSQYKVILVPLYCPERLKQYRYRKIILITACQCRKV